MGTFSDTMSPNAVFEYAGDRTLEDDECKDITIHEQVIAKKWESIAFGNLVLGYYYYKFVSIST